MNLPGRFWSKVEKTDGCWLWTGATGRTGYGRVAFAGRNALAHRLSWEAANGPVPQGLELDHLCRARNCVRPDHLRAVTHRENLSRMIPRAAKLMHCKNGHPFDGHASNGQRICRRCTREYHRLWQARRAALA